MNVLALTTSLLLLATPKVGDKAPEFTAQDAEGKSHTLSQMLKNGPVIVAFFPKAFTSGCTREMTAYSQRYTELEKTGAQLLAISTDDAETLKKFKQSLNASFAFIPDPKATLATLYDVKAPVLTLAQRYTFVVGQDGKVVKVDTGADAIDVSKAMAACPRKR